jgi:hypothetical protein
VIDSIARGIFYTTCAGTYLVRLLVLHVNVRSSIRNQTSAHKAMQFLHRIRTIPNKHNMKTCPMWLWIRHSNSWQGARDRRAKSHRHHGRCPPEQRWIFRSDTVADVLTQDPKDTLEITDYIQGEILINSEELRSFVIVIYMTCRARFYNQKSSDIACDSNPQECGFLGSTVEFQG